MCRADLSAEPFGVRVASVSGEEEQIQQLDQDQLS